MANRQQVLEALKGEGLEVLDARNKGGFYIRGEGFVSLAQARKRTGIAAPKRNRQPRQQAWGDYATIAMMHHAKT